MSLLLVSNCERTPVNHAAEVEPLLQKVTLNYSQVTKTLFIAAQVDDPQGLADIDSVDFRLIRLPSANAETGMLFLQGRLYDDGTQGDIIIHDGIFSHLISADILSGYEGYYRVEVQAFDVDGHSSAIIKAEALVQANTPPSLFLLEAPTTFEKGDTLLFRMRVTDLQGYGDIAAVTYTVLQPTGILVSHPSFALRDDGKFGDEHAHDGIFTVQQPSNRESKLQGLFTFNFVGRDIHGASSDTLKVSVRNPGVTVLYPDLTDTLRSGQAITIRWESAYIDQVKIEYTIVANQSNPTYNSIATWPAAAGSYSWTIPSVSSSHCKIRISDNTKLTRYDVSDREFIIQP